jgi:3-isopropylmalate dehydrogenase/3-isopropylmalate/(R)-2-methylmalate dehydratase small subunit
MKFQGKAWRFGDNIDTDAIIPARYLNTSDPAELAQHCMEDADPQFSSKVGKGDLIVAGKNFGSGSSREHAPLAIKTSGVSCVIASSFARIFYRNAFNIGLLILESPDAAGDIRQGDIVEVDTDQGVIKNLTSTKDYKFIPVPPFMQQIIAAGGLINYLKLRKEH